LKKRLITDPVVAYPRSDRKYVLITDAATRTDKIVGGFGAILTQVDEKGNHHVIAYGSRQLRDYELNYSPYLAEMAAANWGMEYYKNYLRGKPFTLYTDHKPLEKQSHLHTKTMNRLQENMLTYDFQIQYKKGLHYQQIFCPERLWQASTMSSTALIHLVRIFNNFKKRMNI